ncbi:MAG: hypothetical protein ABGZ36_13200, partial [Actinomycetota bacterium]
MTLVDRPGEPTTFGQPQRAAGVEAQLLRGDGVHAADTIIDHGCFGSLLVRAASVRGTYARYQSGPREDDYTMGAAGDAYAAGTGSGSLDLGLVNVDGAFVIRRGPAGDVAWT